MFAFEASPFLHWVMAYGYPALIGVVFLAAADAPLPVEALLIGLGVLSAQGHGFDLLPLALLGTLAAVGGDVVDYELGRLGGPLVRRWLAVLLRRLMPKGTLLATQTHGWRRSGRTIFVTRFLLPWLGMPVSLLAGSMQVAFAVFLAWDVCGEAIYVAGNLTLGRWASGWLAQGWFAAVFWGLVVLVTLLPALIALRRGLRNRRPPDDKETGLARESSPHPATILLLIADTGSGHRSAAQAIRGAMRMSLSDHHSPWCSVTSVDAFAVCGTFPLRKLNALYSIAIKYTPWLYGRLFHLTNRPAGFKVLERLLYLCLRHGLARLFTGIQPDVIVSLHPLLNHASLRVLTEMQLRVPFLTVMTDLLTPHRGWVEPRADGCAVPTQMAGSFCCQHGMAAEKIYLLGMPIDLKFRRNEVPKELLREKLGLDPALPTLLLAGGGEGAGKLAQMVRTIWQAELQVQLLVVAGRNKRLHRQLERWQRQLPAPLQRRCRVLGFVHNMPELMRAADLMVTKAGPGSICEAMVCKLPLLLTGFVPGQEEGNMRYVCENGIGRVVETPEQLLSTLRACLQLDSPLLEQMRCNMVRLANPLAALHVAVFIRSYLPDG